VEILFGESLVEGGSRVGQLAGDFSAQVGWRRATAYPLHQRSGKPRRHEEADELAAPPCGNVDADHSTFGGDGRTAAHAGIERAGEVNLFAVAVLDQPVVGALADGEAEVERVAHRIEPLTFRQIARHRSCAEREERRILLVEAHDREIVRQVDAEHADLAVTAIGCRIFEPIGLGLEHELRDHMIVGDGEPVGGDEES
jgi:hypothetical protein